MMIVLLLFLQKQNLANAIYLFGLGTLLLGSRAKLQLAAAIFVCLFTGPDAPMPTHYPLVLQAVSRNSSFLQIQRAAFDFF